MLYVTVYYVYTLFYLYSSFGNKELNWITPMDTVAGVCNNIAWFVHWTMVTVAWGDQLNGAVNNAVGVDWG